jgi:diguanylate cyclase (GGDEF) domain
MLLVITVATRTLTKKNKHAHIAYINLTAICILCYIMIHYYRTDNAVFFILSIPMMISLLYIDRRPLLYAFVLDLVFYLVYSVGYLLRLPADNAAYKNYTEITTTSIMIMVVYIVSRVILNSLDTIVSEVATKDEKIRRDCFTGLLNHSSFYENLDRLICENQRKPTPDIFSLIVWDIDNFKSINDTFGHDMGDKVLLLFTKTLNECIGSEDLAFRYGGEEFTVITPCEADDSFALSARVRQRFSQYTVTLPLGKVVTASAGVCEYTRALFGGSREFFSAADRALYSAKRQHGKNASCLWCDDIIDELQSG